MSLDDNFLPLLEQRARLQTQKKAVEAEIKELDAQIRPVLVENTEPVTHVGFKFECTMQPGRKTLDKKAMEADGIDLTKYEKVGAPFTKLNITELK